MSQYRRSAIAISLAGLGVWASAQAIDPKLQVVSGTSSAPVVREVPLTSARYEASTRTLVATTRAGNFVCSTAPSSPPNALKLRLDGATYPIATTGLPGNLVAPIEYLPSAVTFALGLLGSALPATCVSSNTTTTNLGLLFDTQRRLPVAESVFFDIPTRTFQIRVAEPVVCESYVQQGSNSGLAIRLNDSNAPLFNAGTAKLLPGFTTANYGLGGFNLVPSPQGGLVLPRVQCSVPGSSVTATPGGGGTSGPSIFNSGFEELTTLDDPSDVMVTIAGIGTSSAGSNQRLTGALPGGTLQYTVTVMNNGTSAAANVRLREFVTGAQAISQAGQSQPAQLFDGGNGSCVRIGATGPCPAVGFPISLDLGTIPAGQGYEFTLVRIVNPNAVPGQRSQAGYAAFVDPAGGGPDANLTNNGAWLAADLISNQQPVIAVIGNQSMSEDGAPLAVSVSIVDPEGDPLQAPTVSSNNTTLFPPGINNLSISGSSSPYTLTMTPAPDKNGVATITVSAGDGNSAPVTRTFQITVNALNDPPTFALNVSGNELVVTEGSSLCVTTVCNASALDFITNRAPGPAAATDEGAQIVRANTQVDVLGDARLVTGACVAASVDGIDPALFFSDGDLPRVNGPVGVGPYNLVGRLARVVGAVDCAITVIDNGTPNAVSSPQTLRIRYQQAPPP